MHEGTGCVAAHQVTILTLLATHQSWQTLLHCDVSDDAPSQVVTLSCRETMTQIRRACLIYMLGSSCQAAADRPPLTSSHLLCLQSRLIQAARTKRHARQTCMVHHSSWWMRDRRVACAHVLVAVVTQIPSCKGFAYRSLCSFAPSCPVQLCNAVIVLL